MDVYDDIDNHVDIDDEEDNNDDDEDGDYLPLPSQAHLPLAGHPSNDDDYC